MKKDDKVYLGHIFDAIQRIEGYLQDIKHDDFMQDEMRFSATVRQLEIVGEAATKMSDEFKSNHPHVQWRKMIGMRNILIHQYSGLNEKTIWATCKENLPVLKEQIAKLLT